MTRLTAGTLAFLVLALGGCKEDQRRAMASCELETTKSVPASLQKFDGKSAEYFVKCMRAAGYIHILSFDCQPIFDDQISKIKDEKCYESATAYGRILQQVEEYIGL